MNRSRDLIEVANFSKAQQSVFACLAAKPNELVRAEELLAVINGRSPKTIHTHIMDIRRKLHQHDQIATIETVSGQGYILRLP